MGLLDGLGDLGLGNLEGVSLFEDKKEEENKKTEVKKEEVVIKEEDFLYDKTFECPVCGNRFKQRMIRAGKAKLLSQDRDLRPLYEHIDVAKYDVILCSSCGYAVLPRFYGSLPKTYRDLIRKNISTKFTNPNLSGSIITYDQALTRYKMALLNAVVRHGKNSEKAYICMKTAWLLRNMQDDLEKKNIPESDKLKDMTLYRTQEREYLKNAREGFLKARTEEVPPYAAGPGSDKGLNTATLDYLIGILGFETETAEAESYRILQEVVNSSQATKFQKENASEVIVILKEKIHAEE